MEISEEISFGTLELQFALKIFGTSGPNGLRAEDEVRFKNEGKAYNLHLKLNAHFNLQLELKDGSKSKPVNS